MIRNQHQHEAGFSLLELSIVLTIIALIMAGGLVLGTAQIEFAKLRDTQARLDKIEAALQAYALTFDRLPCPANRTLAFGNAAAGQEVTTNTGCITGTGILAYSNSSQTIYEGSLPTRTLQLPDSYMLDGWGRRFSYAVDADAASLGTILPFAIGGDKADSNATGAISVDVVGGNCSIPSTLRANANALAGQTPIGALYVVFSHGKNGHGAWFKQGGTNRVQASINNASEYENSHFTAGNIDDGSFDNCFVQGEETVGNPSSASTTTFDDILRFKPRWQLTVD